MWTVIIILAFIAIIGWGLLNSKEEGEQATGAVILGSILPNLVEIALTVGFIVLVVKACS